MILTAAQNTAVLVTPSFPGPATNVTLRVVRDDGQETLGTTTVGVLPDGTYQYQLTPNEISQPGRLTLIWTATINGFTQSYYDYLWVHAPSPFPNLYGGRWELTR